MILFHRTRLLVGIAHENRRRFTGAEIEEALRKTKAGDFVLMDDLQRPAIALDVMPIGNREPFTVAITVAWPTSVDARELVETIRAELAPHGFVVLP